MTFLYGRDDRFYCAKQVAGAYATIRNTGGAASVSAADACLHKTFTGEPTRTRLASPDKESTATLGYIDRTRPGRFAAASASVSTPLFSGSGAGVQPDNGCILESAFGKVTAGGGSVTYAASGAKYMDEAAPISCELWHFNGGAAKRGKVAYGAIVNRLTISAGQDFADLSADFLCYNVLTQDRFPAASTAEKGGLTAWPAEPTDRTYTGVELTGFTGTFELDGQVYTILRSFSLACNFNRQFRADKFTNDGTEFLPTDPIESQPEFVLDFSLHSQSDSTNLDALLAKIAARTPFDASFTLGTTPGGIYTVNLNNLIVPDGHEAVEGDGDDRKAITVSGLRAQITSTTGSRDECSIVIS